MKDRYALMWSGGKDSALALQRSTTAGLAVERLISFYDAATRRIRFHATPIEMLQLQTAAIGIELRAIGTPWPEMEARLAEELRDLRSAGFSGVIFGDIHLVDVRAWYEERVTREGLKHVEPLWGEAPSELLAEYVHSGGRAVVTCVDSKKLDRSWLGRVTDQRFLDEIGSTGIDASGENGEYHTFAFDGPVFKRAVQWTAGEKRSDGQFLQLDIVQPDENQNFISDVALSRHVDPRPTLQNLAQNAGLSYDDVVHHALVRYASSGAEALLAIEPNALRELIAARKTGDWTKVGAIIDWLEAGLESQSWR